MSSTTTTTTTTTTTPHLLNRHLLRPPLLDILRATGFTRARPSVLDTLLDLTTRYLTLLSTQTALHAQARTGTSDANGGEDAVVTITDVRRALMDVGALHPQLSELEEQAEGEEDLRGVNAFLEWARGDVNAEIRRVAGVSSVAHPSGVDALPSATGAAAEIAAAAAAATATATAVPNGKGEDGRKRDITAAAAAAAAEAEALLAMEAREDYLTQLKKKHSKTGEESRWQGTVLGKDAGEREVVIEGWEVGDIKEWGRRLKKVGNGSLDEVEGMGEGEGSGTSSPLSEMSGSGLDSGFG